MTTSRFKDFGSPDTTKLEPISFKLFDQTFNCIPAIQGKIMLDLVADSASEDNAKSAGTIVKFITTVLDEESLPRFLEITESKDKIVSVDILGEISGWLVEQYTDRPNQQPGA